MQFYDPIVMPVGTLTYNLFVTSFLSKLKTLNLLIYFPRAVNVNRYELPG